jgi:hypothetical protein
MALRDPDEVPVDIHTLTVVVIPFASLETIASLLLSCDDGMLIWTNGEIAFAYFPLQP